MSPSTPAKTVSFRPVSAYSALVHRSTSKGQDGSLMTDAAVTTDSSSARIVAEIRRRIAAGDLIDGDRVPSTRQITRDFGVAMATATKALAALQQAGLVRALPGIGTVVTTDPAPPNDTTDPASTGAAPNHAPQPDPAAGTAPGGRSRGRPEQGAGGAGRHPHRRRRGAVSAVDASGRHRSRDRDDVPLPARPQQGRAADGDGGQRLCPIPAATGRARLADRTRRVVPAAMARLPGPSLAGGVSSR